jgi:p-cumate 2,3-dioxygenase subunit alpha
MGRNETEHLIIDDRERGIFRVNRRSFTDPAIFERERREIFDRSWLYVCHASELAKPGNFITRKVGGRALLIARDAEGVVRAFFNACTHRGNIVCREKSGTARAFMCFYHAWTFSQKGELMGVPGEDGYAPGFDRKELGLKEVPRFANYRGLMFACFDAAIVSLEEYLGNAREHLDAMIDFGGEQVEIVQGAQSYSMRANWKLLVENSMDGYHATATHLRYFRQYMPDIGMDSSQWMNMNSWGDTSGIALDNGHAVIKTPIRPTPISASAATELAATRAKLDVTFGKERAHQIADYHRNLFIFPNLILISLWHTVRTFYPIAPDYMEIDSWGLFPANDSEGLRQKRFANFLSFLGPGGFATPDDVAALEGCQKGFATQAEAWSDISRGMGRAPQAIDEQQMRAFWRRWQALMAGERGPTECSDRRIDNVVTAK